jgi:hypothetical protein
MEISGGGSAQETFQLHFFQNTVLNGLFGCIYFIHTPGNAHHNGGWTLANGHFR